ELLHESRSVCILGNHDELMLRPELVASYTTIPILIDAIDWCRAQLSAASLAAIRGFRDTQVLPLNERETLLAFHGIPSSNTTDLLATTDPDTVEEWVGSSSAGVLVGGHTHLQML